MAFFFEE